MADAMVIASLRAEIAQIRAEKDAEISKLRYDVALERGEKERLAKTGRELTAAVAALEGQLRTTEELLDLERARCARMSEALHKARTMRDNADRVRHQMQRGVTVAFNQLQRSAVALEVEMKDLFAGLNERPGHDFDVDLGARDLDEPRSAAPPVEPTSSAPSTAPSTAPSAPVGMSAASFAEWADAARRRAEAPADAATDYVALAAQSRRAAAGRAAGTDPLSRAASEY